MSRRPSVATLSTILLAVAGAVALTASFRGGASSARADQGPGIAIVEPHIAPPASGPLRVKTWYYYGLNDVNAHVPADIMARYAEFAEDDGDRVEHATAFKRAGGRYAVSYTDPAYVPYCFPPFAGPQAKCEGQVGKLIHDERGWFHGPDGTRVRRFVSAHFGYQEAINPASSAAREAWKATTEAILRNGPMDLFYADDSGGPLHAHDMSPKSSEFYDFNEAGVEITSDDVFRDQWIAYLSYAARPIILNGDDPTDGKPSYGGAWLKSPHVWGASHEGCFRHGNTVSGDADGHFVHEANSLLANTALHKFAICFVQGPPTPATRMYTLAAWWLTYDPLWSVMGPIDPVPGQSSLLPELSIAPEFAQRTAVESIAALRSAGGPYVREFRGCYQEGKLVGACAAIVNADTKAVALPALSLRYGRRLTLGRDDLLHGGGADWVSGVPATVPALSALILAR